MSPLRVGLRGGQCLAGSGHIQDVRVQLGRHGELVPKLELWRKGNEGGRER